MGTDYRLGQWIVRPQRRIIECGEESLRIKPKPMAVLDSLAAADGEPVSRNTLFDTVWSGAEVSDATLTKCVQELRQAFGDTARDSRVIETIPKLGFRLLLPVERLLQQPSVAVLPFENMSGDIDSDYFSDGMSEEILNALANANRMPVISRTSSFRFRGQNRDLKEIGRLLGVTHVLEGSVRRAQGRACVTVQLIDAASDRHVWSDVYDREIGGLFALQHAIAGDIVEHINEVIQPPASKLQPMWARRTGSMEAYEYFLRGMQKLACRSPLPIEQAPGYFDQALALDSHYADAWAAKGRALYVLARPSFGHPHIPASVFPGAIACYRKALDIEPGHVFAMGWLGVALIHHEFNWAEGMQLLRQSIERNPNDAELLSVYGSYLDVMNKKNADEVLDRAYRLDPFNIVPIAIKAFSLLKAGRVLDALTLAENGLIGNRDEYAPNHYVAIINLLLGRLDAAQEHLQKARQVAHPIDLTLDSLGWLIDSQRSGVPFPWDEWWQRAQVERLGYLALHGWVNEWPDEAAMVRAFDLAIEQRHYEVLGMLFGPRPKQMPEEDWQRIRRTTGVSQCSGLASVAQVGA